MKDHVIFEGKIKDKTALTSKNLLQNHSTCTNFDQNWHKASLSEGNSVYSNEDPCSIPRG